MLVRNEKRKMKKFIHGLSTVNLHYYNYMVYRNFRRKDIHMNLKNYEVSDSEGLIKVIENLLEDRIDGNFAKMTNTLLSIPEEKRLEYIENMNVDNELKREFMNRVSYYAGRSSFSSIRAYDCTLIIVLSDLGKRCGYLSKKVAWEYKAEAAKIAQQTYSSWEEYVLAFYAGFQFNMSNEQAYKNFVEDRGFKKSFIFLITSKYSPIRKINWNEFCGENQHRL